MSTKTSLFYLEMAEKNKVKDTYPPKKEKNIVINKQNQSDNKHNQNEKSVIDQNSKNHLVNNVNTDTKKEHAKKEKSMKYKLKKRTKGAERNQEKQNNGTTNMNKDKNTENTKKDREIYFKNQNISLSQKSVEIFFLGKIRIFLQFFGKKLVFFQRVYLAVFGLQGGGPLRQNLSRIFRVNLILLELNSL